MDKRMTVGVLGAGTMGIGITIVMLRAGHSVVWRDLSEAQRERGVAAVRSFLDRSVSLGKLSEDAAAGALARIEPAAELIALAPCDVVVEAVFEDIERKRALFAELEDVCDEDALFLANTSTLSVTAIAAGARRPDRVLGTHYCNPAPLMKLVEVVRARQTGDDAYARTLAFVDTLGKVGVTTRDSPGFIVNRFLVPFENDCIRALEAGIGSVEAIDAVTTGMLGNPMGTFRLLDIVGLDIHRAVSLSLYDQLATRGVHRRRSSSR
jgi:3-hydroxybutyryl-CoA dehydrogenase